MFVASDINFVQNGFLPGSLNLEGSSYVRSNGILTLTNSSSKILGHAFYPSPLPFKKSIQNKSEVVTFSTTFVFSIVPKYPDLGGHGLAFVLISTKDPKGCLVNQYMGLPNETSCLEFSTLYLAVEFDAIQNPELEDINDNHVGIDISSLISNISKPAIYYSSDGSKNTSISLKSGRVIQAWVDYNEEEKLMNVTISPFGILKPSHPLISYPIDLSSVLNDNMYAGFSASNGLLIADYNIHGWSFRLGGKAQDLDKSSLPLTQSRSSNEVVHQKGFAVGITFASAILFILVIAGALHVLRRIRTQDEILEDWELEYGALRFKYSELHSATGGFGEKNLIGYGGFGKVYRGVIRCTGLEVAVKRVAPDSRQGMKEFVAEITSMGRIRHRNLVQLHGWCRRHHELLLIYDYVPNGSLDRLLFENEYQKKKILTWDVRYKIVTGVAKALLYLHEECDLRVVHRDVKPSNVLIDADFQPKLGDFGLAKTSEHGIHPKTTHIVGTLGYMAPELTKTGKATTSTDVYGYGILILEVVSGRRAIEPQKNAGELVLVDWVRVLHSKEETTRAVDPSLDAYDKEEADLVLTLGLLCSHPHPDCRPSMRRIVQFLMGDAGLPPLPLDIHCQVPRSITAYTDNFQDDSDASSSRMSSLKSCSHTSFDKVVFANHVERAVSDIVQLKPYESSSEGALATRP
ncbi:L-type lectin-domain containing receptor kinase S.4-like [Senna tora]|uniref:non-specific serine/threonine protein kinase n=1 Tax=Senna tora TaxID=362788 RepID=A0A834W489_9FABA|nr:L-type lectin-domain containing receptor kinase S.4-like [Senna tora]